MHRIGKYIASIILDIFTASGGILAAFRISSVLLIASPSPNMSAIFKHVMYVLLCCCLACGFCPAAFPLVCLWLPAQAMLPLPLVGRGRPPALAGAGRPQALISAVFNRLRYDPVVEDDFALAVPDDVGQVGVAGDDLGCDAARKQS